MNTTNLNGTGNNFPHIPSKEIQAAIAVAYAGLLLVALTVNSFVVHVAYGNNCRLATRFRFNLLVINLAICDFIYAVVAVSVQIGYLYMGFEWFQGYFALLLCKFKEFALVLVISVSVYTRIAMAVEIYFDTKHALKNCTSRKKVQIAIAVVWLVSCLLSAPELFKYKTFTEPSQGTTLCVASWIGDPSQPREKAIVRVEYVTKLFIFYVIPLFTMATLYGIIIRFLWKRIEPNNQGKIRRNFREIVRTLVSMVMVFALGRLPVHVVHLMSHFDRYNTLKLPFTVYFLMFWIAHANCAVNPCLYFVFDKKYSDELGKVVQRYLPCYAWPCFDSTHKNQKPKYSFSQNNRNNNRVEQPNDGVTELIQETKL